MQKRRAGSPLPSRLLRKSIDKALAGVDGAHTYRELEVAELLPEVGVADRAGGSGDGKGSISHDGKKLPEVAAADQNLSVERHVNAGDVPQKNIYSADERTTHHANFINDDEAR